MTEDAAPAVKRDDQFWARAQVPLNYEFEENGLDFCNPIQVADFFAGATGEAAFNAAKAERITANLNEHEIAYMAKDRELSRLRKALLAKHYSRITKTASSEIQDAFILTLANEEGRREEYDALEEELGVIADKITILKQRLELRRNRLKVLEKNADMAKQFLDFDKMLARINAGARG